MIIILIRYLNIYFIIFMLLDGYFDLEDIYVFNKFCFNIDFIFFIFLLLYMDKKYKYVI